MHPLWQGKGALQSCTHDDQCQICLPKEARVLCSRQAQTAAILTAKPLLWQSDFSIHTRTSSDFNSLQLRRLAVALRLLPHCFDLGFCALHAFCPAQTARIFAAVASSLAGQGRTAELRSLLQNVQGTVTSDEWDQVCPTSPIYARKSTTVLLSKKLCRASLSVEADCATELRSLLQKFQVAVPLTSGIRCGPHVYSLQPKPTLEIEERCACMISVQRRLHAILQHSPLLWQGRAALQNIHDMVASDDRDQVCLPRTFVWPLEDMFCHASKRSGNFCLDEIRGALQRCAACSYAYKKHLSPLTNETR